MDSNMLDLGGKPHFDESIVKVETHTHLPYSSTRFGDSDEIRIPFHQPDTYVLLNQSVLYIEGTLTPAISSYTLVNNAGAYMFSDIRLEMNGVEIDHVSQPGLASTMKGYVSLSRDKERRLASAGWVHHTSGVNHNCAHSRMPDGKFTICLPLDTVLGVCEDYKKIFINCRFELILIRSANDKNVLRPVNIDSAPGADVPVPTLKITNISWKIPYISLSDESKLQVLSTVERDTPIHVPFRTWDLYMYPKLPKTTQHVWTIKSSSQLEKPRYVIFGLQTSRSNNVNKDMSLFDHCKLKNARLRIGSERYPYDALNLNFTTNSVSWLYEMYARFQQSYYGHGEPMLSYDEFIKYAPLVVFD